MASANNVIPFSNFTQAVPALPAEQITQFEIAALLSLRNRLRQLEEQIENAEQSIQARLSAGASVEEGEHIAALKETFRRSVAWKEVVMRLAVRLKLNPEQYCQRVLNATKPTRTVSLDIA